LGDVGTSAGNDISVGPDGFGGAALVCENNVLKADGRGTDGGPRGMNESA
jgi:hypothetical protein